MSWGMSIRDTTLSPRLPKLKGSQSSFGLKNEPTLLLWMLGLSLLVGLLSGLYNDRDFFRHLHLDFLHGPVRFGSLHRRTAKQRNRHPQNIGRLDIPRNHAAG